MIDYEQIPFATYEQDGIYHIQCCGFVPGHGHVYATLIVGEKEAILFDAGWGYEDIMEEYVRKITKLPVKYVVSHGHRDHMGRIDSFRDVWMKEEEMDSVKLDIPEWRVDKKNRKINQTRVHYLKDFEEINLGGRTVTVIPCAGHTWGSICLYDSKTKLLLCGDSMCQRVFLFKAVPPVPFKKYISDLKYILDTYEFKHYLSGHHPEPFPREWFYKIIRMLQEFDPGKAHKYERDFGKETGHIYLYTVGRGFGDPEYCGFAYNDKELETLLK